MENQKNITDSRPCTKCRGTGKRIGNNQYSGKPCSYCRGRSDFPGLDVQALVDAVLTGKKGNKRFRKSKPKVDHRTAQGNRIYYVWRMARFHGGVDVCMPIVAMMDIEGDPFAEELEIIASRMAKIAFGTDLSGTMRWGGLLGWIKEDEKPKGLPEASYEGGIVHDGNKPDEELIETV